MGKSSQTREEWLQKRRVYDKNRRERIKKDPEAYEKFKKIRRDLYYKKKAEKKIVPVRELPASRQKVLRERNKINCRRYRAKKKTSESNQAEPLIDVDLLPITHDPLNISKDACTQQENNQSEFETAVLTLNHGTNVVRSQSEQELPSCSGVEKRTLRSSARDISTPVTHESRPRVRIPRRLIYNSGHSEPSPALSSASSDVSSASTVSERQGHTGKGKENTKPKNDAKKCEKLKRKHRYDMTKECKVLHKRIAELTQLNNKYRKQVHRLQKNITRSESHANVSDNTSDSDSNFEDKNIKKKSEIIKEQVMETVRNFYLDDDNSRMCPGKKECITKNKIKMQKRYLTESIHNLHKKFNERYPNLKVSYSHFWKLKPFWVLIPSLKVRDTCLCKQHENMELIVTALRRQQIINEKTSRDVLTYLCCSPMNVKCLSRECKICQKRQLQYNEFDNSKELHYWTWKNVKKEYIKDGLIKTSIQCIKAKITAFPKDAISEFQKMLKPYLKHCTNIVSQSEYVKNMKNNLRENEVVVHCDFSENYGLKHAQEIQAMHFGGSRQQITLHTVVIYYVVNGNLKTQAFCTISQCLRHDAVAIWEHLIPILKFIEDNAPLTDVIHFISDSPSGQYRNRKMFFVVSKLHWHFPSVRLISWNYSESGHGKGAPDGVGGVLKRSADQIVARGHDIPDLESLLVQLKQNVTGVLTEVIDESGILQKDLLIPTLPKFSGTMQVHQAVWDINNRNVLALRKLSCNLGECGITSAECHHGQHVGFFNVETEVDRTKTNVPKRQTKASKKCYVKSSSKKATKAKCVDIANKTIPSDSVASETSVDQPLKDPNTGKHFTKGSHRDKHVIQTNQPKLKMKSKLTTIQKPFMISAPKRIQATDALVVKSHSNANSPKNVPESSKDLTKTHNVKEEIKILSHVLYEPYTAKTSNNVSRNTVSESSAVASNDSFWTSIPSVDKIVLTPTVGDGILSAMDNNLNQDTDEEYDIF